MLHPCTVHEARDFIILKSQGYIARNIPHLNPQHHKPKRNHFKPKKLPHTSRLVETPQTPFENDDRRTKRRGSRQSAKSNNNTKHTIMSLNHYLNKKVLIITVDGRTLTGTLVSCDQVTNLVLQDTMERIIREQGDDEPSSMQPHGLYLVRGDNVVVCGLVDEELDDSIDWTKVRGDVIGSTKHV
ncbi:hypothetical protein Q7P37_001269 [Cladosporium fusiforme]